MYSSSIYSGMDSILYYLLCSYVFLTLLGHWTRVTARSGVTAESAAASVNAATLRARVTVVGRPGGH
jgi:hypothetical protein